MTTPRSYGLCCRCQHRADFMDIGYAPRCECGALTTSVHSCYMYKPCRPLVLAANKGDRRTMFGPSMFSSRVHAVGEAPGVLEAVKLRGGWALYYDIEPRRAKTKLRTVRKRRLAEERRMKSMLAKMRTTNDKTS